MESDDLEEILEAIETIRMEVQFEMEVMRSARAYYTQRYMAKKAELQEYEALYKKIQKLKDGKEGL